MHPFEHRDRTALGHSAAPWKLYLRVDDHGLFPPLGRGNRNDASPTPTSFRHPHGTHHPTTIQRPYYCNPNSNTSITPPVPPEPPEMHPLPLLLLPMAPLALAQSFDTTYTSYISITPTVTQQPFPSATTVTGGPVTPIESPLPPFSFPPSVRAQWFFVLPPFIFHRDSGGNGAVAMIAETLLPPPSRTAVGTVTLTPTMTTTTVTPAATAASAGERAEVEGAVLGLVVFCVLGLVLV
ncbi:hypothetical protein B0T25DRAFT_554853 [Lasiosphaeria hispida]|uniref:Uncharacterized protein n=1 Tax=Lasiosphaeria hispida TaxID=260671 RepID=A0AAJ0H8E5_9PEZI|nr:hypothetical protein B0T25DRAFT_554853 [Lasiosphaeria hispida]